MQEFYAKLKDRFKCCKWKSEESEFPSCQKVKVSKEGTRRGAKWLLALFLGICAMWLVWGEFLKFLQASVMLR